MRSGKLKHRVEFQRNTPVGNAFGEPVPGWAELDTVWASVDPLTGRESFGALQVQADVDSIIKCRYNSTIADLAPEDRAVFGSLIYDIKAVLNIEQRNREFHILAKQHI